MKWLLEHGCAALFLDPGLGKTSVTLAAFHYLKKRGQATKALIIAPLRVCYNVWPDEIRKWSDFSGLRISVLHGTKKDKALAADADLYVINPEGLDWLLDVAKTKGLSGRTSVTVNVKKFKQLGFDTLIVDELSKFKHPNTNRFKSLKTVLPTFRRRWGLTGSPAANGLMDLFGQAYILDLGRALGPYISHYKARYFHPVDPQGWLWALRPGAEDEIYKAIAPLALRMSAEDYLELPELVEERITVDLPDGARKAYDQLEHDLITRIDAGTVVAANAAVASIKCRQVASGGIYLDTPVGAAREWSNLHNEKSEAVRDLVDELQGNPVLVAYDFEHDLDRLRRVLGTDTPHIGGGVSAKRSSELVTAWNRGDLPVLLGHPQSIGHGLNLQDAGHHVVWHSLTWDFELYDQFIRRVWRQGSRASRVFVYHIVARNTIDEIVLKALRSKKRGQDALFAALKELRR